MKKLLLRLLIVLVVLVIAAVFAVGFFLDAAIKRGVETVGPMVTKVDVKLQSASLSLLSGSGKIKGLVVGNPPEFKTPNSISVGSASLAVEPKSIFSDKIIIKSVVVTAPEITYEQSLSGNNLGKIKDNVSSSTGGTEKAPAQPKETTTKEAKPAKKLQVNEFVITGGKVHVSVTGLGGQSATMPLPEIRLENLGTGPDGITPTELSTKVLQAVLDGAAKQGAIAAQDLAKNAVAAGKGAATQAATNVLGTVKKGIGGLFK
jgi:uncharacterized protein involved in outer membrane biogenesis